MIYSLATLKRNGFDIPKVRVRNTEKALDNYCRAAKLGVTEAYRFIGLFFEEGLGVEKKRSQASAFAEVAAKKGDIHARHHLGCYEGKRGNRALAIRHYKMAAEAGLKESLDALKTWTYLKNDANRLKFAEISRKCLAPQAEMRTDQRDAWAKHVVAKRDEVESD